MYFLSVPERRSLQYGEYSARARFAMTRRRAAAEVAFTVAVIAAWVALVWLFLIETGIVK
jgi:hypothetical protein